MINHTNIKNLFIFLSFLILINMSGACLDNQFIHFTNNKSPEAVYDVQYNSGTDSISLFWKELTDTTLSKVVITYSPGGETPIEIPAGNLQHTFESLTPGTYYTFTLISKNNIGNKSKDITITAMAGGTISVTVDTVQFNLKAVQGKTFYTGSDDGDTAEVFHNYALSEFEITYELWETVRAWAMDPDIDHDGDGKTYNTDADSDLYSFPQLGERGGYFSSFTRPYLSDHEDHPVTGISWRDSILWCNALTEFFNAETGSNKSPVFFSDNNYSIPIRSYIDGAPYNTSAGSIDTPYIYSESPGNTSMANCTSEGFRLPTSDEWELASRFIKDLDGNGDILDDGEYYPGTHVSGDISGYCYPVNSGISTILDNYGWHDQNSMLESNLSTQVVGTAGNQGGAAGSGNANALGLFDMSGNVWEFCFTQAGSETKVVRGGGWYDAAQYMRVGHSVANDPGFSDNRRGFRIVVSLPAP